MSYEEYVNNVAGIGLAHIITAIMFDLIFPVRLSGFTIGFILFGAIGLFYAFYSAKLVIVKERTRDE